MTQKWCPRCDQGWVTKLRVIATSTIIQCCNECEAVWGETIDRLEAKNYKDSDEPASFTGLVPYLESQGLRCGPGIVEDVFSDTADFGVD